ncbi:YdcF family protein [Levilactobacillus brevis]|uniref:YdcF family protein n=1 Tax=Levilactobacillus hammesii TaxID=267633 RepID=A0A921F0A7_9LACO|nr:YdcF family protein [Levilactobacillus brevis]HJE87051.1 YdcF family protein [Levilactobacillus hammesii]
MLLSASIVLICLVILLTIWDPHGLTSAVVTILSGGLITLMATLSQRPWAPLIADTGRFIIAIIGCWGLFTLLLIIGSPRLIVRKREHLAWGLIAGIWVWLFLGVAWIYAVGHGAFNDTIWPWLSFIPAFSLYLGIFFAAGLVGYLRVVCLRARHADTLVVLGAGLINGDQIGRVLGARLDTALAFAKRQDHPVTLIVTGGQGPDESLSEAAAMADYLTRRGYPAARIIQETAATNTRTNLINSQKLWWRLPNQGGHVVLITNGYHLFRTRLLAHQLGIHAGGYPAPTRPGYIVVGWAREFLALIMLHPRLHRGVLIGLIATNVLWMLP